MPCSRETTAWRSDAPSRDERRLTRTRRRNQKVINFLINCGNKNLQYLLVPSRLDKALNEMDTDRDGHIDIDEWEECIEIALKNKLAERAAKRELDALAAQREIAEFTGDFLNAARKCFELIDKDGGGTLSTAEIVNAVKTDEEVIKFLRNCGEENLQFLLQPARLKKALEVLDEDGSGEIDIDECAARRLSLFIRSTRRLLDGVAVRLSGRATWSRLTGRLARRGASDPARPLEAARPAGRGARAAGARGGQGGRRVQRRVPLDGAQVLRPDRQGRVRDPREARDRAGRPG